MFNPVNYNSRISTPLVKNVITFLNLFEQSQAKVLAKIFKEAVEELLNKYFDQRLGENPGDDRIKERLLVSIFARRMEIVRAVCFSLNDERRKNILDDGFRNYPHPLMVAAMVQNTDAVRLMVPVSNKSNIGNCITWAIVRNKHAWLQTIISSIPYEMRQKVLNSSWKFQLIAGFPLSLAVKYNRFQIVFVLLSHGADPKINDDEPMKLAEKLKANPYGELLEHGRIAILLNAVIIDPNYFRLLEQAQEKAIFLE